MWIDRAKCVYNELWIFCLFFSRIWTGLIYKMNKARHIFVPETNRNHLVVMLFRCIRIRRRRRRRRLWWEILKSLLIWKWQNKKSLVFFFSHIDGTHFYFVRHLPPDQHHKLFRFWFADIDMCLCEHIFGFFFFCKIKFFFYTFFSVDSPH